MTLMRTGSRRLMLPEVLKVSLVLAACGGDDGDDGAGTTEPEDDAAADGDEERLDALMEASAGTHLNDLFCPAS